MPPPPPSLITWGKASSLSFRYARRSYLVATVPEASIELDLFAYHIHREIKSEKFEPLAPYTDISVIIFNNRTGARIADVKVAVSIVNQIFLGIRKEKLFVRFRPFFVDPGHRSKRHNLCFDERHPTAKGTYYRYGIEKFIAENFVDLLTKRLDDNTKLPICYEVVNERGIVPKNRSRV